MKLTLLLTFLLGVGLSGFLGGYYVQEMKTCARVQGMKEGERPIPKVIWWNQIPENHTCYGGDGAGEPKCEKVEPLCPGPDVDVEADIDRCIEDAKRFGEDTRYCRNIGYECYEQSP